MLTKKLSFLADGRIAMIRIYLGKIIVCIVIAKKICYYESKPAPLGQRERNPACNRN